MGPTGPQGPAGEGGQMQSPWLADINASGHVLSNAGSVAIGTPDPMGAALNVIGEVTFRQDMVGWNDFAHAQLQLVCNSDFRRILFLGYDSGGNNGVIQPAITGVGWNNLLLNPAGQGYVGINTPTPGANLHVYGRTILQSAPSDPWCLELDGSGSTGGPWLGSDAYGNMMIADVYGYPHFFFTQTAVASINTGPFDPSNAHLQVQGGICVQGYDDALIGQIRIINAPYGVILRHDSGMFGILVTPAWAPWGGWSAPLPFQIDLGSKRVGICANPNPNFGLTVDSIQALGGGDIAIYAASGRIVAEGDISAYGRFQGMSAGTGIPQLYAPVDGTPPLASIGRSNLMICPRDFPYLTFYVRDENGQLRRGEIPMTPIAG